MFGGLVCGLNNKSSRILEKSELFGGTRGVGLMRRHKKHNVNPVKKTTDQFVMTPKGQFLASDTS